MCCLAVCGLQVLKKGSFLWSCVIYTPQTAQYILDFDGQKEKIKTIIQNRPVLSELDLHLPNGEDIRSPFFFLRWTNMEVWSLVQ